MTLKFTTATAFIASAALAACTVPSAQQAMSASESGSNVQATVPAGAPADAQSRKVVAAANAFLATLTPEQKAAVMFDYADAAQRVRWSNLPEGIVSRKGVARRDMTAPQKAALETLLASVLSAKGLQMVHEQMDADDELLKEGSGQPGGGGPRGPGGPPPGGGAPPGGARPPGGGGGGGGGGGNPQQAAMRGPGGLIFGSPLYFVSFLGAPSTTTPWVLQYGGHHLAINAAVAGPNISLSPSLTGGQPLKYTKDGKTVWIVENEVTQSLAMLGALTPAQRAKAVISPQLIDLVTGPGHDGQVLQPEGLPASEMTEAQKAQFLKLIEARLDVVNDDDLAALMAIVRRNLNQTYFAWWGATEPVGSAYFRVTGPDLLIEFSPQRVGSDYTQHAHNMYRDGHNEYGSGWARAR